MTLIVRLRGAAAPAAQPAQPATPLFARQILPPDLLLLPRFPHDNAPPIGPGLVRPHGPHSVLWKAHTRWRRVHVFDRIEFGSISLRENLEPVSE
jgi:hypothetical protein